MTKPKVFIQEPWGSGARRLFASSGFPLVATPEECDIIVFNGGEDLNPKLYGQEVIKGCYVSYTDERDKVELAGYERAKDKFKFGICRGGQLLNVLNGGTLWQDVTDHNHAHHMLDIESGKSVWTSSVHHQQFILGPNAITVATCEVAQSKVGIIGGGVYKWSRDYDTQDFATDVEVAFYEKDRALCIQGHPEYGGYGEMTDYCFDLIKRYY